MTNYPTDAPKANILVVDDTRNNLRLLVGLLTKQGYKVRPASSGKMALAATLAAPPDLILLDIMMPEMDGYEVCEHLKADDRTRDIPIIFVSAMNEVEDKVKAFAKGGVDYITKPYQSAEVLARVETHLTLRYLQKNLEQRNRELATFNQIGQIFSSTLDLDQVMETVLTEIQYLLDIVSISFWRLEPETNELVCQQAKGPGSNVVGWRLEMGQGITGWVAEHGESMLVPDTWLEELHFKGVDKDTGLIVRSMLSTPLRIKGKVIGVLDLVDTRIGIFNEYDVTLLEPIAASAAVAIENARLFEAEQKSKERAEAAYGALAGLNAVAVTVNESLDMEINLERALQIVLQILELDHAWLLLSEDNGRMLRLIVDLGFPEEFRSREAFSSVDRCACGEALTAGKVRCYFDKNVCRRLTPYLEEFPALSTQHITLPIFAKQKTIALLNLGGANVVNLTPSHYEWLETVSQQIGNALDNGLLHQNTLNKAERLSVINRISTTISQSWQLEEVLPPLLSEVARVLGMNLGVIVLRSNNGQNKYKVRINYGSWQAGTDLNSIAWDKLPLLNMITKTQAPLLISKPNGDPRLEPLSTLIEQERVQTVLVLPLVVQNQLIGFMQLFALSRELVFETAEMELTRTLTNQAAIAIEKARLYQATVTRYKEEQETAHQIQQNLLPRTAPNMPGLKIAGLCQAAHATGGDFYDYILLPNHQLGIVVGDVTGKSLPAAMVMALARNTIRAELVNNPQPDKAMTIANHWLCQDIRPGTFVATVQALIDPRAQHMWLVNAGQTATLLCRGGQTHYLLTNETAGFPLGIQPDTIYTQLKIPLQADDTLLFYTDGLVEAKNSNGTMFSFDRLETSMQRLQQGHNPEQIIEALVAEIQNFVGEAEQHDDITLVVVQVE